LIEIYLVFSSPRKKEERNPTHIAHIAKAAQANAAPKALSKSAILPTHSRKSLSLIF
jgi:hypothetical protein